MKWGKALKKEIVFLSAIYSLIGTESDFYIVSD